MKDENIIRRKSRERRKGKTDWARVDALTDEEIEASITNDPDWEESKDIDWSKAVLVIPPRKKAISIRLDEDVLDYFKKEGAGYQRRMNAVLRSYMQQKRKKRANDYPASSFFTMALALLKSMCPAKRSFSAAMVRPMSLIVAASSSLISPEMASPASISDKCFGM